MNIYLVFYFTVAAIMVVTAVMLKLALERGYLWPAAILGVCLLALVVLVFDIVRSGVPR